MGQTQALTHSRGFPMSFLKKTPETTLKRVSLAMNTSRLEMGTHATLQEGWTAIGNAASSPRDAKRAFVDCLLISENIGRWVKRRNPALTPGDGRQESRPWACRGAGWVGSGHARQARRHKHESRARPGVHTAAVKSPGERDVPV